MMKVQVGFGAVAGLAVMLIGGYLVWRAGSAVSSVGTTLDGWKTDAAKAIEEAIQTTKEAAAEAASWVNPVSTNNIAYRATNAGLTAVAGSPTYVSDALFNVLQTSARQAERDMLDPLPELSVWDIEDAEMGLAMRAATVTPGGAYIGYGHAFGRRR